MANSTLVYMFGGTTQKEPSKLRLPENSELRYTYNLIADEPKIYLGSELSKNDITSLKSNGIGSINSIKGMNWKQINARFLYCATSVIDDIKKLQPKNIVFIAHSRGCGIATLAAEAVINSLNDIQFETYNFRLILLDPVSKNTSDKEDGEIPRERFARITRELADKPKPNVKVFLYNSCHFINSTYTGYGDLASDFQSYTDRIVGTARGKYCRNGTPRPRTNKLERIPNLFLLCTLQAHQGMFDANNLPLIKEVIQGDYHGDWWIGEKDLVNRDSKGIKEEEYADIFNYMDEDDALQEFLKKEIEKRESMLINDPGIDDYIRNNKTSWNITWEKGGYFEKLKKKLDIYTFAKDAGKDRFRAVVHHIALKKLAQST